MLDNHFKALGFYNLKVHVFWSQKLEKCTLILQDKMKKAKVIENELLPSCDKEKAGLP